MARRRNGFNPLLVMLLLFSQVMMGWTSAAFVQAAGTETLPSASVRIVGNEDPATHLEQQDVDINPTQDTALDVLTRAIGSKNIGMSTQYEGMIDSIFGLAPEGTYFWAFYVNGESASVGANDYVVQIGDQIEFRYVSWSTASLKVLGHTGSGINVEQNNVEIDGTKDTALDVLTRAIGSENIGMSTQYEGMIDSIYGLAPEGTYFWAFYVNGESASVGANDYVVQIGDQIEFRYVSWSTASVKVVGNTESGINVEQQDIEIDANQDTALDVLSRAIGNENIGMSTQYEGMIDNIFGLAPEGTYFWAFYVNGQSASVGAKDYVVQIGDQIEFRYVSWSTASVKVVGNSESGINVEQNDLEIDGTQDTALDVLTRAVGSENIGMSTQYEGMIDSIFGLAHAGTYYWAFYVNDESASIGAKDYVVQIGDQIEFRYESWETPAEEEVTPPGPNPVDLSEPPTAHDQSKLVEINSMIEQASETVLADRVVSEWDAITLAVAGQSVPASYKTQLLESSTDFRQATDLSKRILAIRAVGLDPQNVNGVNYIEQLYQREDATTLVNNTIWSLIALESGDYTVPSDAKFTKEDLVASLISKQNPAGWWKLMGSTGDFDLTSMAITALSVYRDQAEVKDSIAKAVQWLSLKQSEDGGFYDELVDPSPTLSQVIMGLVTNEVSPSGASFQKSQGSAISKQLSFYHEENNRFYSKESSTRFATRQAVQALVAYRNYIEGNGQGFLYRYQGETAPETPQAPGDNSSSPSPNTQKTITIAVKGPDSVLLPTTTVQVEGLATPVTALKKAIGASQVGVDSEGYVYSIMGVEEFAHGAESGWNYSVNESFPTESAGYYELADGADVKWLYTLDLGKDVGASSGGGIPSTSGIPKDIPLAVGEALQKLKAQASADSPNQATVLNDNQRMSLEDAKKLKEQLASNDVLMKKTVPVNEEYSLIDPKGEVQFTIPKNALRTSQEISVEELKDVQRTGTLSSIYEFLPKGTTFQHPAYISLKVPLEQEKLENLVLAWWDEKEKVWRPLPSVVDAKTGTVTALVDHFTQFAVVDLQKVESKKQSINVDQPLQKALEKVLQNETPSDWEVFALARAGQGIPKKYRESIDQLIQEQQGNFRKVTDVERMALTIKVIGGDPNSTSGYNLLEKIYNHDKLTMQGTNGVIFALIALDSGNYEVPAQAKWNRERLLSEILKNQNADGGFVLAEGETSNVDITAMALAALAPYQDRTEVKAATAKAMEWISKVQLKNGGLVLEGQENSESVAQTIIGLTSLGINPRSDAFTKETGDLVTNLLRFQNEDGGFSNHYGQPSNPMATEQALMALVAYHNWANGKEGLYELVQVSKDRYDDESEIAAYAMEAVYQAKKAKVMSGISLEPPLFAPKKKLTRAEFTSLLIRLKGEEPIQGASLVFDDVQPGAWYYGEIARAKEKGYISGVSPTQFAPERPITREEMAVMMAKAFGLENDGKPADILDLAKAHPSYLPYIEAVWDRGIMVGYQKRFEPKTYVTREMAATIAMKLDKTLTK